MGTTYMGFFPDYGTVEDAVCEEKGWREPILRAWVSRYVESAMNSFHSWYWHLEMLVNGKVSEGLPLGKLGCSRVTWQ